MTVFPRTLSSSDSRLKLTLMGKNEKKRMIINRDSGLYYASISYQRYCEGPNIHPHSDPTHQCLVVVSTDYDRKNDESVFIGIQQQIKKDPEISVEIIRDVACSLGVDICPSLNGKSGGRGG